MSTALEAIRDFEDRNGCNPFRLIGTQDETRRLIATAIALATSVARSADHIDNCPMVPVVDITDAVRGIITLLELADFSAAAGGDQ